MYDIGTNYVLADLAEGKLRDDRPLPEGVELIDYLTDPQIPYRKT